MDDRLRDEYFARACDAVEYADAHLDGDLSLGALAEVACFSPRHFHRIFTSLFGASPAEWRDGMKRQGKIKHRQAPVASGKEGGALWKHERHALPEKSRS